MITIIESTFAAHYFLLLVLIWLHYKLKLCANK